MAVAGGAEEDGGEQPGEEHGEGDAVAGGFLAGGDRFSSRGGTTLCNVTCIC